MTTFGKYAAISILVLSMLPLSGCSSNGPAPQTFTISGTAVNLARTDGGLVLQDNANDTLPVNANGSFVFSVAVTSGDPYNVTIFAQPSNPSQSCGVVNGSGTATANVSNIQVNCGHNEWEWAKGPQTPTNGGLYGMQGSTASANNPGGRQTAITWTDSSGNFWLFGGYGYDSAGTLEPMNDLWKYSAGQWTWEGGPNLAGQKGTYGSLNIASPSNIPGARFEAVSWLDSSGDLWLFGGNGFDSVGTEASLNDLWKYSGGQWTWMSGSDVADQNGAYGMLHVPSANNVPGGRLEAVSWVDSSGNFWLFGGFGYDSAGTRGILNDLWKYSNGEWSWEGGSNVVAQNGVFGVQGMASASNVPGARYAAFGWADSSGNLWLMGGQGYTTGGNNGLLSDLWKYSGGEWTWVSGSTTPDAAGQYGMQGVSSGTNAPGARQNSLTWTDAHGNLWLFGGNDVDADSSMGLGNDLWKYSNGEWTWVSGARVNNGFGTYGTQGSLAPGNVPGARFNTSAWIDATGNLWLFGGYGVPASGTEGDLSDLWMYMP
jgi:N-acetylneuraminic acid mutarotase